MGSSIIPNLDLRAQVSGGQGQLPQADIAGAFLQALLAGQQNQTRKSISSQQHEDNMARLGLQKEAMKIDQQRMEIAQLQEQQKLQQQETQGEALKQLLPFLIQSGQMSPAMMGGQPSAQTAPQGPVAPRIDPLEAMASIARGLPGQAVPGFVKEAQTLLGDARAAQKMADEKAAIERALVTIKDPAKAEGARAVLTFAQSGANLPTEMQRQLWPQLFPAGQEVNPAAMQAATTLFKTGQFTWGQARRQAGLQQFPGIPDDTKYPLDALLGGGANRQTELQAKAGNFLTTAQNAAVIVENVTDSEGGLSILGDIRKGATGDGIWQTLIRAGTNAALSKDQQRLVQATSTLEQAVRFWYSGQQSSDKEKGQFVLIATPLKSDDLAVKQQKKAMIRAILQGMEDVTSGHKSRVQVLEEAVRNPAWAPEQKQWFQKALNEAKQYEAKIQKGNDPFIPDVTPAQSPDQLQRQIQEMQRIIKAGTMGVTP